MHLELLLTRPQQPEAQCGFIRPWGLAPYQENNQIEFW